MISALVCLLLLLVLLLCAFALSLQGQLNDVQREQQSTEARMMDFLDKRLSDHIKYIDSGYRDVARARRNRLFPATNEDADPATRQQTYAAVLKGIRTGEDPELEAELTDYLAGEFTLDGRDDPDDTAA